MTKDALTFMALPLSSIRRQSRVPGGRSEYIKGGVGQRGAARGRATLQIVSQPPPVTSRPRRVDTPAIQSARRRPRNHSQAA